MSIKFTKHALRRARERHLWKYVSKDIFWFDAIQTGIETAQYKECVYKWKYEGEDIKILTMYHV